MGRPQFSQSGTSGGGQTVATTSRPELVSISEEVFADLAAGSSETMEIYASTGSIYNVSALEMTVPDQSSGSTGKHYFQVRTMNDVILLFGRSTYTGGVKYRRGFWDVANDTADPPNQAAQAAIVRNLRATENVPIKIKYVNDTDVAQTQARRKHLVIEEESY